MTMYDTASVRLPVPILPVANLHANFSPERINGVEDLHIGFGVKQA